MLGHWLSKKGLNIQAFEAFTKAKELAESYKDVKFLKLIQEERCKLCDIMGEINLGYKVQKEYIELLGEINKMDLDQTILKHEIDLELKEIEKKANLDFLTGAYNRGYLEEIVNITLSIGVTDLLSSKATDFDSLLHSADMKLYEAKNLVEIKYIINEYKLLNLL